MLCCLVVLTTTCYVATYGTYSCETMILSCGCEMLVSYVHVSHIYISDYDLILWLLDVGFICACLSHLYIFEVHMVPYEDCVVHPNIFIPCTH